jgi:ubiquinone/menaquinone biosynthesis C-methylase UbiE
MYERVLVEPLFRPWVDHLLERVELTPRDRVLDVACGTGIAARVTMQRLGPKAVVVGVDASEPMLAVARRVAPDIEWRHGHAAALPLNSGEQFDVVLCQQGLQFFPDKPAAAREMRRALAPGGRIAIATWRPLDETPIFKELHELSERHLGPVVDQRHAFGASDQLKSLLQDAGFQDVRVDTVTRTIHLRDVELFMQMNANAIVGMSPSARTLDDAERARIASAIAAESHHVAARFKDAAGLAFDLGTSVAVGRV